MSLKKRNYLTIGIAVGAIFFLAPFAFASENATSTDETTAPEHVQVTLHLRYQDILVFEGLTAILSSSTVSITDNQGINHEIAGNSVFAVVHQRDLLDDAFTISDIAYFSSFDSLLINCIRVAVNDTNACFNWQYVVNGVYPFVGMDKYAVTEGDDIYIYFGSQHRATVSTDSVVAGQSFTAAAQHYRYQTNEWGVLAGVTLGIIQQNPQDPFSPFVIATSTVDTAGQSVFSLAAPGSYSVGIAEDFYFPSVPLTVLQAPAQATSTPDQQQSSSSGGTSGGGSGGGASVQTFNIANALAFLSSRQENDGSFGAPLYTDWVAVALGAASPDSSASQALKSYLLTDPSPGDLLADKERRAMALMALGIHPSVGTRADYLRQILDSFDGTQFGDPNLFNDDVFAFFPLIKGGISSDDDRIKKSTEFILSLQRSDGSWIGGVDMTAATVQALSMVSSLPGVADSLERAKGYLQSNQQSDGKFGDNVFSSAWAMQAMAALEQSSSQRYLANQQLSDGGVNVSGEDNRIWATAYAIPAALRKPWPSLLKQFTQSEGTGTGAVLTPLPPVSPPATSTDPLIHLPAQEEALPAFIPLDIVTPSVALSPITTYSEPSLQEGDYGVLSQPSSQGVSEGPTPEEVDSSTQLETGISPNTSSPNLSAQAGSASRWYDNLFPFALAGSLIAGLYLLRQFIRKPR